MNRRTVLVIIIILYAVITASSVYLYVMSMSQTQDNVVVTDLYYTHRGDFFCVAQLRPNELYNLTELTPQQGTLYQNLVERINVTFRYQFSISEPSSIVISYGFATTLVSPSGWNKTIFTPITDNILNFSGKYATFNYEFMITPAYYKSLQKQINDQIGGVASEYSLSIQPQIIAEIASSNYSLHETFTPILTFRTQSSNPAVYLMEGFSHLSQETVDHIETTYRAANPTGVYVSQIVSAVAFVGLVLSLFIVGKYWKKPGPALGTGKGATRPTAQEIKDIKKSEKLIAEVANRPEEDRGKTVVRMRSFKDLVKVSDDLFKPILSEELPLTMPDGRKQKKFYVIDGATVYEYVEPAGY